MICYKSIAHDKGEAHVLGCILSVPLFIFLLFLSFKQREKIRSLGKAEGNDAKEISWVSLLRKKGEA